ncbi:MAG: FliI/YscN family ATPase [Candidatus Sericytochromatia bacterium]|nr:FliI/YscN family ATPase [Candidatus Sericytochromatia bacterium]
MGRVGYFEHNFDYQNYSVVLKNSELVRARGQVVQVVGLIIEALLQGVRIAELCLVKSADKKKTYPCEVVGFKSRRVLLMPLVNIEGIGAGCEVVATNREVSVKVGPGLLGRVLDGLGNPLDGKGPIVAEDMYPLIRPAPNPMKRKRIDTVLSTGVRVIDGLLTLGEGQRVGLFAGSGVGKSTLLGMIARNAKCDIAVVCNVGERGREVLEFIEDSLGEEGLKRSVVVSATSDTSSLERVKAAYTATSIAEYFRDKGLKVFLMMDSVTRFAMAQREIGLAVGEPPASKGYPPSVFALLPQLLERAGMGDTGSITALYNVLVEGGDMDEPVADAVRGILDGHIVMDRKIGSQNIYPAIDVLSSVSRLFTSLATKEHQKGASEVRNILATYKEAVDLINIGAYVRGSNGQIDHAISMIDQINSFRKQGIHEPTPFQDTINAIIQLGSKTASWANLG